MIDTQCSVRADRQIDGWTDESALEKLRCQTARGAKKYVIIFCLHFQEWVNLFNSLIYLPWAIGQVLMWNPVYCPQEVISIKFGHSQPYLPIIGHICPYVGHIYHYLAIFSYIGHYLPIYLPYLLIFIYFTYLAILLTIQWSLR